MASNRISRSFAARRAAQSRSGVEDAIDNVMGLTPHASRVNGTVSVATIPWRFTYLCWNIPLILRCPTDCPEKCANCHSNEFGSWVQIDTLVGNPFMGTASPHCDARIQREFLNALRRCTRKTCERKQFGTVAIQRVMNERLELISGEEPLVLDSDDGQETLSQATDVFRYIDSNFKHWRCNVAAPATNKNAVQVYEMVRDSTFEELFGGFGVALDALTLTQSQIKQFVKHNRDWLKKGGNGTFFLFKAGNEFFVAAAYFFSDGRLGVRVRSLSLERVFRARKRHRLVVKSS